MRLALYEPDIPQNTGAILRLAACLGVGVDVIEPTGFVLTDRKLRRAGLDYIAAATLQTHRSWTAFDAARRAQAQPPRLILLSTAGTVSHIDFAFRADDILMAGRESEGVPDAVADACDAQIRIPMRPGLRSLNVATSLAIVLGEALRQCDLYPALVPTTVERIVQAP